jgi:uncharacterized protein affecting Mg2+/Co2+ transport
MNSQIKTFHLWAYLINVCTTSNIGKMHGKWKFIEQQGWQVETFSTVRLVIRDLWGSMIGLPNDGDVAIKVMCPKTLCVDGDGRK